MAVAVDTRGADVDEARRFAGQRRDEATQPLVRLAIGRAGVENCKVFRQVDGQALEGVEIDEFEPTIGIDR